MFKISGTLSIRTISGRNGDFSVGRLVTEIGEFSVKDTMLDQYDEGRYEGEFGISRIYPAHYIAGNRLIVEVRAVLESVALTGIDNQLDSDPAMVITEPDPVDELQPKTRTEEREPAAPDMEPDGDGPDADSDARLFGTLWPLGTSVKLDPTVDRAVFRQQRNRLRELGYSFQAVGQIWVKMDDSRQDAA